MNPPWDDVYLTELQLRHVLAQYFSERVHHSDNFRIESVTTQRRRPIKGVHVHFTKKEEKPQ